MKIRKFMDLENIDKIKSKCKILDNKMKNLNWINPEYKNDPKEELLFLKAKKLYQKKQTKKNIITHYQFYFNNFG